MENNNNHKADKLENSLNQFQKVVYLVVLVLLCVIILYLLFHYSRTLLLGMWEHRDEVITIVHLKEAVIVAVSGILAIILCVELLETIYSSYKHKDHVIQIQKVLQIAVIASVRHIFEVDYSHLEPLKALSAGLGLLLVTACYYLYKKTH